MWSLYLFCRWRSSKYRSESESIFKPRSRGQWPRKQRRKRGGGGGRGGDDDDGGDGGGEEGGRGVAKRFLILSVNELSIDLIAVRLNNNRNNNNRWKGGSFRDSDSCKILQRFIDSGANLRVIWLDLIWFDLDWCNWSRFGGVGR